MTRQRRPCGRQQTGIEGEGEARPAPAGRRGTRTEGRHVRQADEIVLARPPQRAPGTTMCAGIGIKSGTIFLTDRSEEHTSELQSLIRISYAVFCLKKKHKNTKRKE